jgi:beta-mannanase
MKVNKSAKLFFIALLVFPVMLNAQTTVKLSNNKASKEAVALYAYINDMFGKKILSGQMYSGWGFDEFKYVNEVTGKYPAIKGLDFIEDRLNDTVTKEAIDWWKSGGIVTIMWHMGAPGIGEGYENSKKEIDIDKCFQEGTIEYKVFWDELRKKGDLLERLKRANVPVLWRPFHELNGDWFWWGKEGPYKFKKLWTVMYDYYVNKRKLNNLIWVLCYTAKPDANWYPGDKYVDIAGADTYKCRR